MENLRIEKWIVTVVALFTSTAAYVADWNESHIYNPNWTPHAKFHNGQTMSMGLLLGILALYFVWRKKGDQALQFRVALIFAALYWVTQASAILYPGSATIDPEFLAAGTRGFIAGIPLQIVIDAVLLSLLALAYYLRRKRDERAPSILSAQTASAARQA